MADLDHTRAGLGPDEAPTTWLSMAMRTIKALERGVVALERGVVVLEGRAARHRQDAESRPCPDCGAPAGTACRGAAGGWHRDREQDPKVLELQEVARRAIDQGLAMHHPSQPAPIDIGEIVRKAGIVRCSLCPWDGTRPDNGLCPRCRAAL